MKVRGMKWINATFELTRIGIELNQLVVTASKYQWKPEFLWTKKEVEEVAGLLDRAYELVSEEFGIYMICGDVRKMKECEESLVNLNREIYKLKQRLAA